MIEAIFFDFGGTIVTEESDKVAHYHIADFVKEKYSIPLSHEEIDKFITRDLMEAIETADKKWPNIYNLIENSFEKLLNKYGKNVSPQEKKDFSKIYIDLHIKYMGLFPDARETLANIRNNFRGHVGIISDIVDDLIYGLLDKYNLRKYFDSITTSEEVGVGKPNPLIFEVALEKANVKPNLSIYIGNSPRHDVIGAKRMGMKSILIGNADSELADFKVRKLKYVLPIIFDGRP